jgi:leucyl aminopeptidase (aminopeptidase T)
MTRALNGALNLLRICAHAEKGENVLVVTDTATNTAVADTIMAAGTQLGLEVAAVTMRPRVLPGDEPPAAIAAAMLASDVIICPTSRTLFHTNARVAACKNGARFLSMAGANMSVLSSQAMLADFHEQEPVLKRVVELLTRAKHITLTNRAGTHLSLDVFGRRGGGVSGMATQPGEATGVPDIEAYIAPLEESANGTLVIDGSTSITGIVKRPIIIDFKSGRAAKVRGGIEARQLHKVLRKAGDRNAFILGEFGIGLNPLARIRGAIIEDEATLGTAHVALGDNSRLGGVNSAPIHIDMVLTHPLIKLDGRTVLNGKQLTL